VDCAGACVCDEWRLGLEPHARSGLSQKKGGVRLLFITRLVRHPEQRGQRLALLPLPRHRVRLWQRLLAGVLDYELTQAVGVGPAHLGHLGAVAEELERGHGPVAFWEWEQDVVRPRANASQPGSSALEMFATGCGPSHTAHRTPLPFPGSRPRQPSENRPS